MLCVRCSTVFLQPHYYLEDPSYEVKRREGDCDLIPATPAREPQTWLQNWWITSSLHEGLQREIEQQLVERPTQPLSFHSFFSKQHCVYHHSALLPVVSLQCVPGWLLYQPLLPFPCPALAPSNSCVHASNLSASELPCTHVFLQFFCHLPDHQNQSWPSTKRIISH